METPLDHILSAQICVENLKFDFFCIGSTNVHAILVQKIANSRRRKIEVCILMPKFRPNLHLIQTITLFLNSNIYEVTFLHMTLWFYNTSKPISRTQSTQYLSDHFGHNVLHFLSFPRPNLKRQRPTSVLWFASTRTPPTISQGDLPFEVIIFVNFIPAPMPWLNWTSLGHLKNVFWKAITLHFPPYQIF